MAQGLKKVLFVCIGNCIRSQMAEGFARAYGRDVIEAYSAGLAPAGYISEIALQIMSERGISLIGQYSKHLMEAQGAPFDLAVNISGEPLPARGMAREIREWAVADPMGKKEQAYEQAAQQIENLVMNLVMELRRPVNAQRQPAVQTRRPGR